MRGTRRRIVHDSVTEVATSATGAKEYSHRTQPSTAPPTTKANRCPVSAATTSARVSHRRSPLLFVPVNQAPTVGPAASSSHTQPAHVGLHHPIARQVGDHRVKLVRPCGDLDRRPRRQFRDLHCTAPP